MRRHLTYANVMATLALVFAMSGGAFAASHDLIVTTTAKHTPKYIVNKLKQINPKVMREIERRVAARIPSGARGKEGLTGKEGKDGLTLLSESEQQALKALLAHVTYLGSGVGGKPTIRFSGVNVQVVGGAKESETSGVGNLVVGSDEAPGAQTGSNNLVLGSGQTFTSFGAIVGGLGSTASGPYSFTVGNENTASGEAASVSGGSQNTASNSQASVSGGYDNTASGGAASISGGGFNEATANGGAAVSGGGFNRAIGEGSSVTGGAHNTASAGAATVTGGGENTASELYASVLGGHKNVASGKYASVFGGNEITETIEKGASP